MAFRIGRKYASHSYPDGSRGGVALALAHAMADNPAVVNPIASTGTVLTSVTVTPGVTGKFKLSASVVATTGGSAAPATIALAFNLVGAGVSGVAQYPATANAVGIDASDAEFVGLEAENGSTVYTGVATPGVPVTIQLLGFDTVSGTALIPAHAAQLTVEELPN